jgi:hypothetical protein
MLPPDSMVLPEGPAPSRPHRFSATQRGRVEPLGRLQETSTRSVGLVPGCAAVPCAGIDGRAKEAADLRSCSVFSDRGRDSNPRAPLGANALSGRRLRPLGHRSANGISEADNAHLPRRTLADDRGRDASREDVENSYEERVRSPACSVRPMSASRRSPNSARRSAHPRSQRTSNDSLGWQSSCAEKKMLLQSAITRASEASDSGGVANTPGMSGFGVP